MQPGLGWAAELSCQLQAPAYGSASCWEWPVSISKQFNNNFQS